MITKWAIYIVNQLIKVSRKKINSGTSQSLCKPPN